MCVVVRRYTPTRQPTCALYIETHGMTAEMALSTNRANVPLKLRRFGVNGGRAGVCPGTHILLFNSLPLFIDQTSCVKRATCGRNECHGPVCTCQSNLPKQQNYLCSYVRSGFFGRRRCERLENNIVNFYPNAHQRNAWLSKRFKDKSQLLAGVRRSGLIAV